MTEPMWRFLQIVEERRHVAQVPTSKSCRIFRLLLGISQIIELLGLIIIKISCNRVKKA